MPLVVESGPASALQEESIADYKVIVTAGPSPLRYQGLIRGLKPKLFWRLDETSGSVVSDRMGGFNGTLNGPAQNQSGLIAQGRAYSFDGVDDSVYTDSFTPPLTGSCSFLCWIRPDSLTALRRVFTKGSATLVDWFMETNILGNVVFGYYGTDGVRREVVSDIALYPSYTYAVLGVRDLAGIRLYVNGLFEGELDSEVSPRDSGNRLVLGAGADLSSQSFHGLMDEFSVFDYALDEEEITDISDEGPLSPLEPVAELSNARVTSIEEDLNHGQLARFTMPTLDPDCHFIKERGIREIQIWRRGQLRMWGPIWQDRGDEKNIFYHVESVHSYLAKRYIETTLEFSQNDQFSIAWEIIDYTQDTHGTLGITPSDFLSSGRLRDRTYPGDEYRNIGESLINFTEIQDGFDWEIEVYGDGRREWTPYYPSKGVRHSIATLEYGKGITEFDYNRDAKRAITAATITGQVQEDNTKPVGKYEDEAASEEGVYLQDVQSENDIKDVDSLVGKAQEMVESRSDSVPITTVTITSVPIDYIGLFRTGDIVPMNLKHGAAVVRGDFRIVRMSIDPPTETAKCTLNPA